MACGAADGGRGDRTNPSEKSRLYTLYFIRHAEALHNQLERRAQSEALSLAVAQGHRPDSDHARRVQEEARRAILESDAMGDPPLSEEGMHEARNAKMTLERLIETYCLPRVEEVWVSPLQRTLQTADVIFPESSSPSTSFHGDAPPSAGIVGAPIIRVKNEIEERHTGLACDKHSPFSKIRQRKTFRRFSLSCLRLDKLIVRNESLGRESFVSSESVGLDVTAHDEFWEDKEVRDPPNSNDSNKDSIEGGKHSQLEHENDGINVPEVIEDKSMLRERTKKLFNLLATTESRSICLIGHKGYLRELERGPLGKADAELFKNCEVRVYRLQLDIGDNKASGNLHGIVEEECDCERETKGSAVSSDIRPRDRKASIDNAEKKERELKRWWVLQRAERIASSVNYR